MIYLAYPAAAAWSLGCAWFLVRLIKDTIRTETRFNIAVIFLTVVPVLVVLGYAPWILIESFNSPVIATLRENEWHCTQIRTIQTMVRSYTRFVEICTTYQRIGH